VAEWQTRPGETPIEDRSGLKTKAITTREELNKFEAENIRRATVKYLLRKPSWKKTPFNLCWALKLHKEMFGKVWTWAGTIRTSDLNLGVPWQQIEISLQIPLDDLVCWSGYGTPLMEQAAMLHHRAVQIHPFRNGNGRWARMLTNIWLTRNGHAPTAWPPDVTGEESEIREEYLNAIRAADAGDNAPLLALHTRFTPQSSC
jgi:Fic-DOC domain mobile mystery protein B